MGDYLATCQGPNWASNFFDFLEQPGLNDRIWACVRYNKHACDDCEHDDAGSPVGTPGTGAATRRTVTEYICPSAARMSILFGSKDPAVDGLGGTIGGSDSVAGLENLAKGNYAANFGKDSYVNSAVPGMAGMPGVNYDKRNAGLFEVVPLPVPVTSTLQKGIFKMARNLGMRPRQVTDGLSKTLLISEVQIWDTYKDVRGVWSCRCRALDLHGQNHSQFAISRHAARLRFHNPRRQPVELHREPDRRSDLGRSPQAHPGGVVTAMGDGSTKFTTDGIDIQIWQPLSTRAGSEAEGEP